jgi:hypothetical protein
MLAERCDGGHTIARSIATGSMLKAATSTTDCKHSMLSNPSQGMAGLPQPLVRQYHLQSAV